MSPSQTCRILSCDGGGIRGLITAVLLERLEEKLIQKFPGTLLKDHFDIIAGTSTGSLIACGVAKGLRASEIKDLYLNQGIEIFPRFEKVFWDVAKRVVGTGFTQPIYSGKGLEKVLEEVLGDTPFGALDKATLITAYDTFNRKALVFKNTKPEMASIRTWEICRASAAAPIAFPAHVFAKSQDNKEFLNHWTAQGNEIPLDGLPVIDGGVVANNPSLCAVAERLKWNTIPPDAKWLPPEQQVVDLRNIVVVSLGTGQSVKNITVKEARGWGAGEWANPFNGIPLVDVLFDGSADAVDYVTAQVLPDDAHYFRFQPLLDETSSGPAFNANPEKLRTLVQVGLKFLDGNGGKQDQRMDDFISKIYP